MQEMQETQVQSLGREDPLEKGMGTTPVFLPGELHGQRSLVGYSPWGHKESDMTEVTEYTCRRLAQWPILFTRGPHWEPFHPLESPMGAVLL